MEDYDPNDAKSMSTVHVVKVTLQQWEYKKSFIVEIGGNCAGFTNMDTAIDLVLEKLYDPRSDSYHVVLMDVDGNELITEDDEYMEEEWLKDMVVAIEIIGVKNAN